MRRPLRVVLLAVALATCGAAQASAALTPTITAFPSSEPVSPESHPFAIAAGPDGQLWFTDPYQHKIGRMTVDGKLTLQAPVPPTTFQYGIAAGSDGAMWFVSQNPSSISRIDEAGAILTKALSSPTANPTHLVAGPEGALWFTEGVKKAIGRIPAETPLATPDESRSTNEGPNAIAAGPDGNLWFTEYDGFAVGRMKPSGETDYFPLPVAMQNPMGIAAGPDGALWVTAINPSAVIRFAPNGESLTYRIPKELPVPDEITAGPDGALWFAAGDVIGRITTDGAAEAFPLPEGVGLNYVAAGPDGNVWFTEENAGRIGRITTPPNATTGPASAVEAGRATVAGTVNGHSQPADAAIEYGPVGSAAATTPATHLATSAADQPVSIPLNGLTPSTTYRYRVVATNPTGTTPGLFREFTTGAPPSCRIMSTKRGAGGRITLRLRCSFTESVVARATTPRPRSSAKKSGAGAAGHSPTLLYAKARARVANGKATLRIKPTKRARALLRERHQLRVKIRLKFLGGGATTSLKKPIRARPSLRGK